MKNTTNFQFRLFIAGDASNSRLAAMNLKKICQKHLPGQHTIEVVDVIRTPRAALQDSIFLTPALIKLSPAPVQRIIGNLSDEQSVLNMLGLPTTSL